MSDNDIPRDDAGKFTSVSDHIAAEHSKLEFTRLEDRREEDSAPIYDRGSDHDKVMAAAAERQAQQGAEVEEPVAVEWFKRDEHGRLTDEKLEPNVETTIDQAVDGLSAYRA